MTSGDLQAREETVYIFTGLPRDGELTREFLRTKGMACEVCRDFEGLLAAVRGGLGLVMLTEDVLSGQQWRALAEALDRQPPWSDVPVILFAGHKHKSADRLLAREAANVTIIEPPVRVSTVISSTRAALRARRRQYELRDLLDRQRHLVQRLEQADRRKDEFLAMLGHELRNPLAAIHNGIYLLSELKLPDASARPLTVIGRQASNLARIVDDLLDISRVTLGKIRLERSVVDLRDVITRCVQSLAEDAARSQHTLRFDLPNEPVRVHGDLVRLDQILLNLVTNAIKYTPSGGHIDVVLHVDAGQAQLSVSDDGIGIEPRVLPAIFELFTQSDQGLARSRGGLGLGLALVRTLVTLHDGTIDVRSDGPGRGSCFTLKLPIAQGALPTPVPEAVRGNERSQVLLVVEDNEDARVLLCEALERWGHKVIQAEDGVSGLELGSVHKVDIALIDIGLPGLDGQQVAQRLRQRLGNECPRLIAMTGYGQPEDQRRALEAGFDQHMVKPLDLAKLRHALRAE